MYKKNANKKMNTLWNELGYTTGNGRDMTSVMHRMDGPPIHEQTLGSADAMLLRLLDGDESMGGTKQPYDPRIHFVLIRDAYLDANPDNQELKAWFDITLKKFDDIYGDTRPGFIEGYKFDVTDYIDKHPNQNVFFFDRLKYSQVACKDDQRTYLSFLQFSCNQLLDHQMQHLSFCLAAKLSPQ